MPRKMIGYELWLVVGERRQVELFNLKLSEEGDTVYDSHDILPFSESNLFLFFNLIKCSEIKEKSMS
jgi:hypothetical protein